MPITTIAGHTKTHKKKVQRSVHNNNESVKITLNVKTIKEMFNKTAIKQIAKDTGFVQRERKLDAYDFFCL